MLKSKKQLITFIILCLNTFLVQAIVYAEEAKCISGTCINGKGVFNTKDGDKYEGEFKNELFNGKGTLTFKYGDKYTGIFKNGKFNGQGVLSHKNGSKYSGQFKDGEFNGKGTLTYINGFSYTGTFKGNLPSFNQKN